MYATTLDLLNRFDANELAQRCDRGVPRLTTPELLLAIAAGQPTDAWDGDSVVRATAAHQVIERALQDAEDTINSYISARYTLPISPVPAVLQRVACEMGRYYVYDDQVTDRIKEAHTANVKWLGLVSDGTVSLGADAASGVQPVSSAGAEIVSGTSVWRADRGGSFL